MRFNTGQLEIPPHKSLYLHKVARHMSISKKLFIVGASGHTGSYLVQFALEAGHKVTAYSRKEMDIMNPEFQLIQGDIMLSDNLDAAMAGHDAVLSAIGPRSGGLNVLYQGMQRLIEAAKQSGVKRLLGIGGAGILEADDTHLVRDMPDFPDFLKEISAAHYLSYELLTNSGLDWTFICPPMMQAGERTGQYRHQAEKALPNATAIRFADVADLMLECAEEDLYLRRRVAIAY